MSRCWRRDRHGNFRADWNFFSDDGDIGAGFSVPDNLHFWPYCDIVGQPEDGMFVFSLDSYDDTGQCWYIKVTGVEKWIVELKPA